MAATRQVSRSEQIVNLLREMDVLTANGKTVRKAACGWAMAGVCGHALGTPIAYGATTLR